MNKNCHSWVCSASSPFLPSSLPQSTPAWPLPICLSTWKFQTWMGHCPAKADKEWPQGSGAASHCLGQEREEGFCIQFSNSLLELFSLLPPIAPGWLSWALALPICLSCSGVYATYKKELPQLSSLPFPRLVVLKPQIWNFKEKEILNTTSQALKMSFLSFTLQSVSVF